MKVNEERLETLTDRVKRAAGGSVKVLTIGILGIAFKPNTDDIREGASLSIIPALKQKAPRSGRMIPRREAGPENAARSWCDTPYERRKARISRDADRMERISGS